MLGDETYGDGIVSEEIRRTSGVKVITPLRPVAATPEHVEPESKAVFLNDYCEIPTQLWAELKKASMSSDATPNRVNAFVVNVANSF